MTLSQIEVKSYPDSHIQIASNYILKTKTDIVKKDERTVKKPWCLKGNVSVLIYSCITGGVSTTQQCWKDDILDTLT